MLALTLVDRQRAVIGRERGREWSMSRSGVGGAGVAGEVARDCAKLQLMQTPMRTSQIPPSRVAAGNPSISPFAVVPGLIAGRYIIISAHAAGLFLAPVHSPFPALGFPFPWFPDVAPFSSSQLDSPAVAAFCLLDSPLSYFLSTPAPYIRFSSVISTVLYRLPPP